ncbi:MAG: hypothetical protein K5786_08725 [Treponema sp.]|nr:hypothetical protein [Treponema sp.]
MSKDAGDKDLHWADEAEAIRSNKPLKLLLFLFKIMPTFLVHLLCYPVSFFYFLCSGNARAAARQYQKQLREFSGGKVPAVISGYHQILNFSLCVLEKMEGWLGKVKFSRISYQDDDIQELLERLRRGESAFLITSHLGNMELMRSLQEYNTQLCGREVPVVIIMNMSVSAQFTQTLKELNPHFSMNVVDADNIGPDSMIYLQEEAEKGALIVVAADRTSAQNRNKVIMNPFLGKPAPFPYGVFLITALMKLPLYYMFGMRSHLSIFNPKYNVHIEKSQVDFNCPRSEREKQIENCCGEFVSKLEKFCMMYPYQWYNFFNFWNQVEEK